MKFFWRYVWNKMKQIGNEPLEAETAPSKLARVTTREHDWHDNLNIAITNATGGRIVTFRRYDHKTDRNDNRVYVIPDDHDFNAELAKLITLESLR